MVESVAPGDGDGVRTVWFYRDYQRMTGGHLKHSHYFEHVRRTPGFAPRIVFGGATPAEAHARERARLWPGGEGVSAKRWAPEPRDMLFVAGLDWRYLKENGLGNLPNPRINLVQGMRHAHEGTELYGYLSERAVRVCVSREVAGALAATGRIKGPVFAIPNGVDVAPCALGEDGSPPGYESRSLDVIVAGYKRPELARALSERLNAALIGHRLLTEFMERTAFLALLAESRVAVCLPHPEEGFYLPALEGMATGAIVVTLDCMGNRGFCRHDENCLIAEAGAESLLGETCRALALPATESARMHQRARNTVTDHSLEYERARFQAILRDIDRLWCKE